MKKTNTHELKTWPEYFNELLSGNKTFEVRKNDRDFKIGDILLLNEYDPENNKYTGRQTGFTISYILNGGNFGIEKEFCVLGIKPIKCK